MKKITGNYRIEPMDIKVWEENGMAMVQANGPGQSAFAIQWQGADVSDGREFRASFDNDVKIIFADDGQSFTLHQGGRQMTAKQVE